MNNLSVVHVLLHASILLFQVAKDLGRQDVAQTWLILKLLYCGTDTECSRLGLIQIKMPSRHLAGSRLSATQVCINQLQNC